MSCMYKKIKISNEKELKRFYSLLPLYKSFIFKFITFKLESKKYNVLPIINALNIKSRRKRICYIYDIACDEADSQFKDKNVCGFKNNKCIIQQRNNSGINGCCRKCRYSVCGKCPTKNLTCKLFFCSAVKDKYKVLSFDDIKILRCLTIRQRILLKSDYFSKREDVITDLYIGSITIGTFRILYRMIRDLVIRKINQGRKNSESFGKK